MRVDAVWAAGLLRQHVVLRLSARGNKQKKAEKIFALRARPSSRTILWGGRGRCAPPPLQPFLFKIIMILTKANQSDRIFEKSMSKNGGYMISATAGKICRKFNQKNSGRKKRPRHKAESVLKVVSSWFDSFHF